MSLPMSRRALGQRRSGADGRCCMLQSGKRDGAGRPRDASGGGRGVFPRPSACRQGRSVQAAG